MPKSKQRNKVAQERARQAQVAKAEADKKKLTPQQYARRRAIGWSMVGVAVVVGIQHWLQHLGVHEVLSPGLADLLIGYPTAGLLGIGGAIVLSK